MSILVAIYISLLTCSPGKEVYAHYGHTAIRVVDTDKDIDWVFNYGEFDFNTERFYAKFIKGETYYRLGMEPYESFRHYYDRHERTIFEQPLHLSEQQAKELVHAVMVNFQPRNRTYLYNFVTDNCATRPYHIIRSAVGDSLLSTYKEYEGVTYREVLNRYTDPQSWVGFGINMIFGSRADQPMHGEERLFLPEILMHYMAGTDLCDNNDTTMEWVQRVPWYKRWYVGAGVFWLILILLTVYDRKRHRLSWRWDAALGTVYMLPIVIATYLTFFSIHPLVGYNIRLLIFPIVHLCIRSIYYIRS